MCFHFFWAISVNEPLIRAAPADSGVPGTPGFGVGSGSETDRFRARNRPVSDPETGRFRTPKPAGFELETGPGK